MYAGEYKTRVQFFDKIPFITIENSPINTIEHIVKTITEIFIAFITLFMLSPILMIVSILIAISSKGPVIFKQERVGLRGRKFYIYKFRTMIQNAEELKVLLMAQNESDGPTFKIKKDPRITTIGRILRKTNLDEIPQLFNVIKGEMSIIGPRPPLPSEVEQYEEWQLKRLSVKPGLTCTWQIVPNRNDVKFEKWMKMDIYYIENWSLKSDIELFFKTFKTVLFARGA
jgi:exopolysaccharide biosynthesis polyprenyl glycosylphosphotransferase